MITEQEWKEAEKKVAAYGREAKATRDRKVVCCLAKIARQPVETAQGFKFEAFNPEDAAKAIIADLRTVYGSAPRYRVEWDMTGEIQECFADTLSEAKKLAKSFYPRADVARTAVTMLESYGIIGDEAEYWRKPAGQPC